MVAISFENDIFVLQISQYTKAGKLPVAIKNILADERILKVGRGIQNYLQCLQTEGNIKDSFSSAVELAPFAKKCHIAPNARLSLIELSALVLGSKLNKDDAIQVSTEWENINLSQDQIMYSAQDAHDSKCIYEKLVQLEKYGNVPQNVKPGLPVIIYQEDGQKQLHMVPGLH